MSEAEERDRLAHRAYVRQLTLRALRRAVAEMEAGQEVNYQTWPLRGVQGMAYWDTRWRVHDSPEDAGADVQKELGEARLAADGDDWDPYIEGWEYGVYIALEVPERVDAGTIERVTYAYDPHYPDDPEETETVACVDFILVPARLAQEDPLKPTTEGA